MGMAFLKIPLGLLRLLGLLVGFYGNSKMTNYLGLPILSILQNHNCSVKHVLSLIH